MNYSFANVPKVRPPRSLFRRNHNLKTTINTDYLYPIYVDEALPGDVFKFKEHLFGRLSTPLTPIMDSLYLDTFYFAVPVRLVDDEFKRLMGERPFGDIRNDYTTPILNTGSGVECMSLSDYLGIPINVPNLDFVPWWHRSYNLIFNTWFADENLVPYRPIAGVEADGTTHTESLSDYVLCRRGKRKDYFTACTPFPQKGEASVFSLGDNIKIQNWSDNHFGNPPSDVLMSPRWYPSTGVPHSDSYVRDLTMKGSSGTFANGANTSSVGSQEYLALEAQLDSASLISVNQMREAFAIQHFLETDARSGTRYIELIRGHFGVISPDARQQRPELLGGSTRPLNVNTVAQTSSSTNDSPQGNLAAFVTANNECRWTKTFTEHTLIIGLANVRADLSYQQGLPRMFSRRTKFDFYFPELANLGEQAVLNKEIYAQGGNVLGSENTPVDDEPFGYQERWAEYRYHPNMITGQFRSTAALTLDYWHLAQKFDSLPVLGQQFIEEHVPIDRCIALNTATAPNMIVDGWFEVDCARLMPLYSVPGLSRL